MPDGNADGTINAPFDDLFKGGGSDFMKAILAAVGTRGQNSSNVNTLESSQTGTASPLAVEQIGGIFPGLQSEFFGGDYSKEAAIRDSMAGVQNLFSDFTQKVPFGLYSGEAATGAYKGTTRKLLQNDLTSRVIAQGQGLVSDNINKYAGIRNQQAANITNMIRAAIDANKIQQTQGEKNVATVGDTTNKGALQNPLLQGLLGASGIYSILGGSKGVGDMGTSLMNFLRSIGIKFNDLGNPDIPVAPDSAGESKDYGTPTGEDSYYTSGSDIEPYGPDEPMGPFEP